MFAKLESLRGLAACLVVLFHSRFIFGNQPLRLFEHGYLFVDFFFVLSGFVMCHAYYGKIVRDLPFREYLLVRLARLYPLHLFMLLVWLPYVIVKQQMHAQGLGEFAYGDSVTFSNSSTFLSHLLLLHSMGMHDHLSWNMPSWSISSEFFAYIVFFAISATIDRTKGWLVPAFVSLGAYTYLFSLGRRDFDFTFDFGFLRCIAGFYLGVSVYRLNSDLPRSFVRQSLWECTACLAAGYAVSTAGNSPMNLALTMASFALLIGIFSNSSSGLIGQLLELRPCRLMGEWSYSMYMVHTLVIAVSSNLFRRIVHVESFTSMGVWALAGNAFFLAITIVISRFTYEWIEKPPRDWVKAMLQRSAPRPLPALTRETLPAPVMFAGHNS